MRTAVQHVNSVIRDAVLGVDVLRPGMVDDSLRAADPSPGFTTLGANAVLAVSLAAERAAAAFAGLSLARHLAGNSGPLLLPMPMVNIISGGAHAGGLIDVQDFLVIPRAAVSFSEAIQWCAEIRDATAALAVRSGLPEGVLTADEGGLGLPLANNRAALDLLVDGIEYAGLHAGRDVGIAIDVAATQLCHDGRYHLTREGRSCDGFELVDEIRSWCDDFPIVSIEDIVAEDDWDAWSYATAVLGERIQLIDDDLFATDPARLAHGLTVKAANAVLVKVNQNGLLSGAGAVLKQARSAGYGTIVSARSGETEDSWLADLAVGWRAGQIKVGSTHRSERGAKWNRLLELEAWETTEFARPPRLCAGVVTQ